MDKMPGKASGKTIVLVADDDQKILRFVRTSLKLAGYEVITVECGEDALKAVETEKPDVMLLDILMPGTDGFEVLKRLRPASCLPVIAFSAHASATDEAMRLGANAFLAKPFRPDELAAKIESVLGHR